MAEIQNDSPLIDPSVLGNEVASTPVTAATNKKSIPDKGGFIWGVGRRKSSVARVRLKPGTGQLKVNNRELKEYFVAEKDQSSVMAPLKAIDGIKNFDVFINVNGGGTTGQAGAALLGIARALINYDGSTLKPIRDAGHLTRDGRMKERKKPGQRGARRRFQFSKR